MEYRARRNIVFSCQYHLVFCPKYPHQVPVNRADRRPKQIIAEVGQETGSILLETEVMPDHVHLLIDVDPQFGIHRAVKANKG
jgi:putative transposase